MKMILTIVGPSYKSKDLLTTLKIKKVLKKHKKQLCLVWFLHVILWANDINKVMNLKLFLFAQYLNAFNNYPWNYDSYFFAVKYLLTKLSSNMNSLYTFPWAFMVQFTSNFYSPSNFPNRRITLLYTYNYFIHRVCCFCMLFISSGSFETCSTWKT